MKKSIVLLVIAFQLSILSTKLNAAEITAINFSGQVIGKVLPDGKAINLENDIIGKINADSQIVSTKGEVLGGIIPQGVAIGNDFKVLGRPNQDGKVISSSGAVVGSVLPNALIIDEDSIIIGAVLFPGIVYSNSGDYVGRLSGDGLYTDMQGTQIGFITPDGYAYKKTANSYILDGKLISSKMVSSLDGELIGSLSPQGKVLSFDGEEIGKIGANEFVYDKSNKVVGMLIKNAYAFDSEGKPIGFVNYDGRVSGKKDGLIKASYNNVILDKNSEPAGFFLSTKATATDLKGDFLGWIMPNGDVVKGTEKKGVISANGIVLDTQGIIIGKTIKTGPIFNYKSDVLSHALFNGRSYNLDGASNGFIKAKNAYNLKGEMVGSVYKNKAVFSNDNNFLGVTGIDNKISFLEKQYIASEQGYMFDDAGNIGGQALGLDFIYNRQGNLIGSISPQGIASSFIKQSLGSIVGLGYVSNELNNAVGKTFLSKFLSENIFFDGLLASKQNLLRNKSGKIEAKILPDTSVVSTDSKNSVELMPKVGKAFESSMAVSYDGKLLGYVDYDNSLKDLSGAKIGYITEAGVAVDPQGLPKGEVVKIGAVLNFDCTISGVADFDAEAKSFRGVSLGKIYPQGYVVTESNVTGYIAKSGATINYDGIINGYTSANAQAYNAKKESLGCANNFGMIKVENITSGAVLDFYNVISFENKILGRSVLNGTIVNEKSKSIGYLQPDGNSNSSIGQPIGLLQKYRYAFDNNNSFMGLVNSKALVVDGKGNTIAQMHYDGSIVSDGKQAGYALYDLFVYNKEDKPVGYIELSGQVTDFEGKNIGTINKGFLADSKNNLIARGNRDYNIRDEKQVIVGTLNFDNTIYDKDGKIIGALNSKGEVINSLQKAVAIAKPLQYYNKISAITGQELVINESGEVIGFVGKDGNVYDKEGNIIGKKDKDGRVLDELGRILGKVLGGEKSYDAQGNLIGITKPDGTVVDINGKVIGNINEKGEVISPNGEVLGGINSDWYKKIDPPKTVKKDTSPELEGYIKSISIALTPDGQYLGKILEDGSVVNDNGEVIGYKQPDGLIVDNSGTLLGIEEVAKKEDKSDEPFMPSTGFGSGTAYGIGESNSNLGPGGGYGPGERYDQTRAQALAMAQSQRRQGVTVGGVKSGYKSSSFDYMQDKWDGVASDLSSWRVDMSEMILADKPIPAVLARSIYNTSLDVPVTAYVERNVYSEEGRNIIIPAGSRLIGKVSGFGSARGGSTNAAKVEITWDRLIRPDGSMFKLSGSVTGDSQGRQGALGYVDRNLMQRYLSPIIFSIATSASSFFIATDEDSDGETETSKQQAANEARQNFIDSMDSVFGDILDNALEDAEIIFVPAGTRIIVYPNKDLWLRSPERDMEESSFADQNSGRVESLTESEKTTKGTVDQNSSGGSSSASSSASGTGSNQVVYENDPNAKAQSGGTKLLGSSNKSTQTQQQPLVVAPPPPPSSSSSSTATPSSSSSPSSSSAPVLF